MKLKVNKDLEPIYVAQLKIVVSDADVSSLLPHAARESIIIAASATLKIFFISLPLHSIDFKTPFLFYPNRPEYSITSLLDYFER